MSPPSPSPARRVGPVLRACPLAEVLVEIMREHNPSLVVVDRGSYLRVTAEGRCRLPAAAVAERLDGPFRLPTDLEQVMSSFAGNLRIDEDWAEWVAPGPPPVEALAHPGEVAR